MKHVIRIFYPVVCALGIMFGLAVLAINLPDRCGPYIAAVIGAAITLCGIDLWERLKP